jgi:hypothetical protein
MFGYADLPNVGYDAPSRLVTFFSFCGGSLMHHSNPSPRLISRFPQAFTLLCMSLSAHAKDRPAPLATAIPKEVPEQIRRVACSGKQNCVVGKIESLGVSDKKALYLFRLSLPGQESVPWLASLDAKDSPVVAPLSPSEGQFNSVNIVGKNLVQIESELWRGSVTEVRRLWPPQTVAIERQGGELRKIGEADYLETFHELDIHVPPVHYRKYTSEAQEESPGKEVVVEEKQALAIPIVSLPKDYMQEGWRKTSLEECSLEIDSLGKLLPPPLLQDASPIPLRGFVIYGRPSEKNLTKMRIVSDDGFLFIETIDPTPVTGSKNPLFDDHLELWEASQKDGKYRFAQWLIAGNGKVTKGISSAAESVVAPKVQVEPVAAQLKRFKIPLTKEVDLLAVVYSDGWKGKKQDLMFSSSKISPKGGYLESLESSKRAFERPRACTWSKEGRLVFEN